MAADVALSQALAYARDLRNLYEVTRAREQEVERARDKLRAAYQQSLTYAVDLNRSSPPEGAQVRTISAKVVEVAAPY